MTEAYSAHEIGHPFEYDSGALGASEVEIMSSIARFAIAF